MTVRPDDSYQRENNPFEVDEVKHILENESNDKEPDPLDILSVQMSKKWGITTEEAKSIIIREAEVYHTTYEYAFEYLMHM